MTTKIRSHIAKAFAGAIMLTIITLVPTARTLTAWLKNTITDNSNIFNTTLYTACGIALIAIVYYFFITKKRYPFSLWLLHSLGIAIPLGLVQLLITHPSEMGHIPLYGFLTIACVFSFKDLENKLVPIKAFAIAFTMGLLDEGLQGLHPERFCDLHDVGLNTCAIILGLIIAEPLRHKKK